MADHDRPVRAAWGQGGTPRHTRAPGEGKAPSEPLEVAIGPLPAPQNTSAMALEVVDGSGPPAAVPSP